MTDQEEYSFDNLLKTVSVLEEYSIYKPSKAVSDLVDYIYSVYNLSVRKTDQEEYSIDKISHYWSWKPIFGHFESSCFTQVYCK